MEQCHESSMTRVEQFQAQRDEVRQYLLRYTRKAFRMIPPMDKPRILDIGCGSGIPTLELARLSQGQVIGIDIDQPALDRFVRRMRQAGLSDRVRAVNCSMFDMDFADESFDIIWSEGSIHAIGFERGLQEWRRFLKPGGFVVVHDEQGNVEAKLKWIANCGYELVGYFLLDEETWRAEYYAPLEMLIAEYRTRPSDDAKLLEEIQRAQEELDTFKQHPERNSSVYFVIRSKQ